MSEDAVRAAVARLAEGPAAHAGASPARRRPLDAADLAALIGAKPWRRSRVDPPTRDDISAKVAAAVATCAPLAFAVPFGGYKSPHQPSAPQIDWAEVFWIAHLRAYGETLAAAHPPGVVFSLSYFHGVLGAINRLPVRDQDRYIDGLRAVLIHFSDARIRFELVDLSAAFGGAEGAMAAIERRFQEMQPPGEAGAGLPAAAVRSAARNLLPAGPEPAGDGEVLSSAWRCLAMESLEERRRFNKFGPRIQITHMRGPSLSLHLGSCRTSTMQPWVGTGVLESGDGGVWRPRILNGRTAGLDARLEVRHPLEHIAPALRCIGVRHLFAPALAGGQGGGGDE